MKLSGRLRREAALSWNEALKTQRMRPDWSRGRTIFPSARGDTTALHGPRQRLLAGSGILVCAKNSIDPGLITGPAGLEPLQYIRIDAE